MAKKKKIKSNSIATTPEGIQTRVMAKNLLRYDGFALNGNRKGRIESVKTYFAKNNSKTVVVVSTPEGSVFCKDFAPTDKVMIYETPESQWQRRSCITRKESCHYTDILI